MSDKHPASRSAASSGEVILTVAFAVMLAMLIPYGLWVAATRRASEAHFRQAVAAGDYRIVEVVGEERRQMLPFQGRILQVVVEPLPYDPAQMEIVCIVWRGQATAAQVERGKQTAARQTTRSLEFRPLCNDIAAALEPEAP